MARGTSAVPATIGSSLAIGLLREVAQHDWHLTKHQLAEGLSWGIGSTLGLGLALTFEWGTGRRPCRSEAPQMVRMELEASHWRHPRLTADSGAW